MLALCKPSQDKMKHRGISTWIYDHASNSDGAVLYCGSAHHAVLDGSNFKVCGWNRWWMKALEKYFPVVLFIMLHKEPVD